MSEFIVLTSSNACFSILYVYVCGFVCSLQYKRVSAYSTCRLCECVSVFLPVCVFVCMCTCVIYTYYSLPPLLLPQPDELLVLPGDKINCCVLQQSSEDEQQAHGHPDVDGLHIRYLRTNKVTGSSITNQ